MKKIIPCIFCSTILMLSGCAALQSSLSNVYNLANCDYKYHSISSLSVSGMNLSNGLSPLMIPKMIAVFSGNASSIPLNFTLNLNVKNPNAGTAAFQALHYIISIDGVQFTAGHFDQTFSVEAGETKVLPITIGVDVAELMRSHSKSAIENIVKNFIGINGAPSKVSIQLKPSFKVGDQLFTSPVYIPVNFNFGGKKNMSATRP